MKSIPREKDGNTLETIYLRGFYYVMGNGRKYLLAREIETIHANFQNIFVLNDVRNKAWCIVHRLVVEAKSYRSSAKRMEFML